MKHASVNSETPAGAGVPREPSAVRASRRLSRRGPLLAAGLIGLALSVATIRPAEAACRPVFVAGVGVIDSCTGQHRDPRPDPPPQPTVIYVEVTFAPEITLNVVNVVSATASSSASANAGAQTFVVKPVVKKDKK